MDENITIKDEDFGDFTLIESTTTLHRIKTNGILIYEYIAIRNLSGEASVDSAKESLRAYLTYFGNSLRKES